MGAHSFYPTKNLEAVGNAGAIVKNRTELAVKTRMLLNYDQSKRYHHPEMGLNSGLDEIQAAIPSVRLKRLSKNTARRREIAKTYFEQIKNSEIKFLAKPINNDNHVYHLYVIHCEKRDKLADHLKQHNIETLIHYPVPMHKQPPCLQMAVASKGLSKADKLAEPCLLCLAIHF